MDLIAANPDRQFNFALFGYIGLLTVVPAFLAAARLSRRRRPVLTTVALAVNLAAYLGAFAMGAIDNLYLLGGLLPADQRDVAAIIIDQMWSTGVAGFSTNLFVLGHIIGAILMGLALRGSIPTLGWLAMLLTTPAHVVAFVVLQMPVVDMAAWLLMTISFAYCAVRSSRHPNDEWDLPPLGLAHGGQDLRGVPRSRSNVRGGIREPTSDACPIVRWSSLHFPVFGQIAKSSFLRRRPPPHSSRGRLASPEVG